MRINREQVLAAALDLLDEVGLDQLTMRRLAAALGVQNGATYWHFRSKQTLLAAMADSMLAGVADVDAGLPWDARVTELARRLRQALLRRRDGGRVFSAVFFPLPNALAYGNALIGALLDGGLVGREAAWTADTVTYYVVAHVTEEQLALSDPGEGQLAAAVDAQRHPQLFGVLEHVPAPHPEGHFEHGLRVVVGGAIALAGQVPSA